MLMASDPSMPFYVNDWLSSSKIACMTLEQQGAYVRLLCYCWASQSASIPSDDQTLARLSGMNEGWFNGGSQLIRNCFIQHPDQPSCLTNEKLLELWAERVEWREKSSLAGKKSGESRRKSRAAKDKQVANQPSTNLGTKHEPNTNSSSLSLSSSLSSKKEEKKEEFSLSGADASSGQEPTAGDRATFLTGPSPWTEEFWAAYPKKTQYNALDDALHGQIAVLVQSNGWTDEKAFEFLIGKARQYAKSKAVATQADRQFLPSPALWLTSGRYRDDPSEWDADCGASVKREPRKAVVAPLDPAKTLVAKPDRREPTQSQQVQPRSLGDELQGMMEGVMF